VATLTPLIPLVLCSLASNEESAFAVESAARPRLRRRSFSATIFRVSYPLQWENLTSAKTFAKGAHSMKKGSWIGLGAVAFLLVSFALIGYQRWSGSREVARGESLALMPADASAVLFADFDELRRAPFIADLYAWAPKPQVDAEYAQFLKDTGFDYERDLDRIAIAVHRHGTDSALFVIADGKFDRQKISAYALKSGTVGKNGGRDIFSVPMSGSPKKISFTFLTGKRMALTDAADLGVFLSPQKKNGDEAEWRARFERLAGSPIFAVIRQDAAAGSALAAQAPGGLSSPQLSALLDQLQWITLAGKPDNDRLRVVADGECPTDSTVRRLSDLLNGVIILAQAGLNEPKARQQLDPQAREAYLELLKNADVSKLDRGDTKSVRVILEITPRLLETARTASPVAPDTAPGKRLPQTPQKGAAQKKGRT
jgi:hypothetical protein